VRLSKASIMVSITLGMCVGVALWALAGCGPSGSGVSQPTTPSVAPTSGGATVVIKDFAFTPSTVTIKVGETVTWRNEDGVPHDATAGTFTSGSISSGQSYTKKFDKAGTYTYVCKVHPSMAAATVIVQ
jgi:plastocyanin